MTDKNEMPDEIWVIKSTNSFCGVWDDYQWSDQRGTKYLRADVAQQSVAGLVEALRIAKKAIETDAAVTDTLWCGPCTTVVDVIDEALREWEGMK